MNTGGKYVPSISVPSLTWDTGTTDAQIRAYIWMLLADHCWYETYYSGTLVVVAPGGVDKGWLGDWWYDSFILEW